MAKKNVKQQEVKKVQKSSFFKNHLYEIIIFVFSFLLFTNSIPNDYNLDDELVTINHRLTSKGVSAIPEIFTSPYYKDNMGYAYEYRPVVLSSFAIEHQIFGDNPHVSHFLNVLLYALCCLLLFRTLTNISDTFSPIFSFVVVLLFAAHSSHTETVSSIKNRDEILGLIFSLLTLFIALKAVHRSKHILLLLLPAIFSLALMNKITFLPFAVIIPMAIIIFTEAKFITLLSISIALVLPSFFLINTGSFSDKVFISLGLVAAPIFLRLLFRFERVTQLLKKTKTYISKIFDQNEIYSQKDQDVEGFNGFFTNLLPPSSFLSFYPIASTVLLGLTYLGGVFFDLPMLEIIAFLLLFLVAWRGNEKWSWWANVLIYLCLALSIFIWHNLFFSDLISISLCYQVFFGNRKLKLPAAIALLFSIAFNAYFLYNPSPVTFAMLFIGLRTRIKWLWAILGIVLSIFQAILSIGSQPKQIGFHSIDTFWYWKSLEEAGDYFALLVLVPLIGAIMFHKGSVYIIWGCRVMALLLLVSYQILISNTIISPPVDIKGEIEIIGKNFNANIINEKQDRPINFIEQPVSPNDSWQIKTGTSMRILVHYFAKTIVPYPLAFYYGYKFIVPEAITKPVPLVGLFIHLLLLLAGLYFLKRNTIIFFAIAIYFISIITFANYFAPIPGIVGDRYLLVPSLGWSILLTALLFKIWKIDTLSQDFRFSKIPNGFKYALGLILCFYSAITFSRNFKWKDSITLFRHDINYVDESAQAHNLLALHIMQEYEREQNRAKKTELITEALTHFKNAVRIYPSFFNATYDLGRVYMELNMPDSAIWAFKSALTIDTSFYTIQINLGNLLFAKGDYREAIPYLGYIIKVNPYEYTGYDKLSFAYYKLNEFGKSIEVNKRAMLNLPGNPDPILNIGQTFQATNQTDSARLYFQKVLKISPSNSLVQQLLQGIDKK